MRSVEFQLSETGFVLADKASVKGTDAIGAICGDNPRIH